MEIIFQKTYSFCEVYVSLQNRVCGHYPCLISIRSFSCCLFTVLFFSSVKQRLCRNIDRLWFPPRRGEPGRGGFFISLGVGFCFLVLLGFCFFFSFFFKYAKHTFDIKARNKYSLHFPRNFVVFVTSA